MFPVKTPDDWVQSSEQTEKNLLAKGSPHPNGDQFSGLQIPEMTRQLAA